MPDTIPEKSTLKFHPHSSWHLHYQILHSNLGQKRELPIAFLQKTHIHLQQPLERKAEITLGNFFQTRYKAALIEPAAEKLLTATEHQLQTFTPKTGRTSQDPFWQQGPLAIEQDYTKITLFKLSDPWFARIKQKHTRAFKQWDRRPRNNGISVLVGI